MIENFTKDEIKQLLKEIREMQTENSKHLRQNIFQDEAIEVLGNFPFIGSELKKNILDIADSLTENYEQKQSKSDGITRRYHRKEVPIEIEEEYRKIINGFLNVMKPYYGKSGFEPIKKG